MKHLISATRYSVAVLLLLFAFGATRIPAQMQPPKVLDQPAKVISHLPLEGAAVTGIQVRQREGRQYLFLETARDPGLIVVNITKPKKPVVVKDANLLKNIESGSYQSMGRGLALVTTSPTPNDPPTPKTIHVLDVSHPGHPRVIQTFDGVTAVASNFDSNLFFFTNSEGLWILREKWTQPPVYPCNSSSAINPLPNCE
jgi:hypothetical protein